MRGGGAAAEEAGHEARSHSRRGQARACSDSDHPDYLSPLLPSQRARPVALSDGVRRLLGALLVDAVACARGRDSTTTTGKLRKHQRETRNAQQWFASDDTTGPFAFVTVCEALGLDARAVRAALPRAQRPRRPVTRGSMRVVGA